MSEALHPKLAKWLGLDASAPQPVVVGGKAKAVYAPRPTTAQTSEALALALASPAFGDLTEALEALFSQHGMAVVVAACHAAQKRVAERHAAAVAAQGWIV